LLGALVILTAMVWSSRRIGSGSSWGLPITNTILFECWIALAQCCKETRATSSPCHPTYCCSNNFSIFASMFALLNETTRRLLRHYVARNEVMCDATYAKQYNNPRIKCYITYLTNRCPSFPRI
jgi:hypothetical protein